MDKLKNKVDDIISKHAYKEENLLPILLEVQGISDHKYITDETAMYIADSINISYTQMSEVFHFFSALNHQKKGVYHIEMCNSTVCRVNEQNIIEAYLKKTLNINMGETTEDNLFTLDYAPCFGACDTSPSVRINKKVYGNLTTEKLAKVLANLRGVNND